MSTLTTTTNSTPAIVMTVAGVSLPASLPRGEASALVRSLIGNDDNIIALASNSHKNEAALAVALGIALQSAVHGDDSAYRRIEARAKATGKLTKAGKIAGKLGKMIETFAQARDFGKAYRDLASPEFNLAGMLESPLCPSLPAPAAPAAAKQQEVQEEPTVTEEPQQQEEPTVTEEPVVQEMLYDSSTALRQIIRSSAEQAQRDRAAARIRTLRAKLREVAKPKTKRQTKRTAAVTA